MSDYLSIKNQFKPKKTSQGYSLPVFDKWLKNIVLKQFEKIEYGQLIISDNQQKFHFKGNQKTSLIAEVEVLDYQFYRFIAFAGSIGSGESYINEYWNSSDLTKVIQLFCANQDLLQQLDQGLASLLSPLKKALHWLNKNTLKGSKKNILAHYDLGNEFFKIFLDPSMMYSAGIFAHENQSMLQASNNKLKVICDRLNLSEDDHVIEIGSGWGGFAIYAAKNYRCKVTTTTISQEQYRYTQKKIKQLKLTDKITLLNEDYRKLEGKYDKLVSIEMIEAVGFEFYDVYFKKCSNLLKQNGEMLLQAITISDQKFHVYRKEVDFIKRYIFPGGCLPSINAISHSITKNSDLRIQHLLDIGTHYAKTLQEWRSAFFNSIEKIKAQGFNQEFVRLWEFYLCYCEGGFSERAISTVQLHLVKPMARPDQFEQVDQFEAE